MRTYSPNELLLEGSWAEDFTPTQYTKEHFMYIQSIGHYIATPKYILPVRKDLHSFLLLYTVKGRGLLTYHNETISLPEGTCAFINCNEPHTYRSSPVGIWDLRWVHFSGHGITGYLNYINKNWKAVILKNGEQKMNKLYACVKRTDPGHEIELSTMLIDLCSEIAVDIKKNQMRAAETISPVVKQALTYFEEHFCQKISLDTLSQELNVSKYHLAHQFKEQTGYSPHEYLIITRLNYAKTLLRSTSKTISSISDKCGFDTSSYFIQAFKKHEGTTPLKYRAHYRDLENV